MPRLSKKMQRPVQSPSDVAQPQQQTESLNTPTTQLHSVASAHLGMWEEEFDGGGSSLHSPVPVATPLSAQCSLDKNFFLCCY